MIEVSENSELILYCDLKRKNQEYATRLKHRNISNVLWIPSYRNFSSCDFTYEAI
jgi:hypothetical protein